MNLPKRSQQQEYGMSPETDHLAVLSNAERAQIEGILFQFDSSWSPEALPEAAKSIPPDRGDVRKSILEELVKIDIERRWSTGNGRELEDYLEQFPDLGSRETVSAGLIQTEYEARKRSGNPASSKQIQQRFPGQFEELKRLVRESAKSQSNDGQAMASLDTSRSGAADESVAEAHPHEQSVVPTEFGRYRIVRSLGKGAMGAVSLAHDTTLERDVAIKTPTFSGSVAPELIQRFLREAKTAATLQHPNICPVYDVGEIDGQYFISMAYIEGRPLSAFIGGDKQLPQRQVAIVVRKLALALEHAHANGVVHRDLKPANIMVNQQREPIVMDFGLAFSTNKPEEARVTQSGTMLGTPAYMSPEQVDADLERIAAPTDIYSLGVIFYEFLTGQLPYNGSVAAILGQIMTQDPPKPSEHRPDLDPALEAICLKMMAKKLEDRYASMKDVAAALTDYLKGTTESGGRKAESGDESQPEKTFGAEDGLQALFAATDDSRQSILQQRGIAKIKEQPGQSPAGVIGKWRSLPPKWKAGVAIGFVALLASIVLLVRQPDGGTLRIEVNDPNIEVLVDGETITLKDKAWEGKQGAKKHTLAIKVGDQMLKIGTPTVVKRKDGSTVTHKLTLKLNGAELTSDSFEIVRGSKTAVKISHVKLVRAAPSAVGNLPTTKLPAVTELPVTKPPVAQEKNWIPLFDGKSLDGWRIEGPAGWSVENGAIVGRATESRLVTVGSDYKDIEVRVECKLSANVNSGVHVRTTFGKGWQSGYEAQLSHQAFQTTFTGGIPRFTSVKDLNLPDNEWFALRFRAEGRKLSVFVNGKKTSEVTVPAAGPLLGAISLQSFNSNPVWFRKVEVRRLNGVAGETGPDSVLPAAKQPVLVHALTGHTNRVMRVRFTPDGTRLVSASNGDHHTIRKRKRYHTAGKDNSIRVWSIDSGKEIRKFGMPARPHYGPQGICLSPNGRLLAVGTGWFMANGPSHPHVYVWDISSGKLRFDVEGPGNMTMRSVAFSPDGSQVFVSRSGFAEIRSLPDGKLESNVRLYGRKAEFPRTDWSPDLDYVLGGVGLGHKEAVAWDRKTGEIKKTFSGHSKTPTHVIMSPDGRRVLSCALDFSVRLWDWESAREIRHIDNLDSNVRCVAFSPDGKRFLTGSQDGTVTLRDTETFKVITTLNGHQGDVIDVAFSPNGQLAASGGDDCTVRVWRLPRPESRTVGAIPSDPPGEIPIRKINTQTQIEATALSPDGRYIAVGGPGLLDRFHVYDTATGKLVKRFPHGAVVSHLAYIADGSRIVSAGLDQTVSVWDTATGELKRKIEGIADSIAGVQSISGGRIAVLVRPRNLKRTDGVGWLQLHDITSGALLLKQKLDKPLYLGSASNGRIVSVANRTNHTLYELTPSGKAELKNPRELKRLKPGGMGLINGPLVFSPDGRFAVTSVRRMQVEYQCRFSLWDVAAGTLIRRFDRELRNSSQSQETALAFSPDGKQILAGSFDGTVNLWDRDSGKLLNAFKGHSSAVSAVSFTPDHRFAVTAGKSTIRVWRIPKLGNTAAATGTPVVKANVTPSVQTQRAAAVTLMQRKGVRLSIQTGQRTYEVDAADKLPKTDFTVVRVILKKHQSLTDEEISLLGQFHELRQLLLSKNSANLTNDRLRHISGLTKLESLSISRNPIGDVEMKHLSRLKALTTLSLRGTRVGDQGLQVLARLPNLKWLNLRGTQVSDKGLKTLGTMKSLTCLYLIRTKVTCRDLSELTKLESLERLSLGDAAFLAKSVDLKSLKQLKALRRLWVRPGSLSKQQLEHWQKELPNVNIIAGEPPGDDPEDSEAEK